MIKLYHGSPKKFNEFDLDFVGENATDRGFGIYLTDDISLAADYTRMYGDGGGYIYEVDFYEDGELSLDELTLDEDQIQELIERVHEKTNCLTNWGDVDNGEYGYALSTCLDNYLNYSESDMDVLGSLINESGCIHSVLEVSSELFGNSSRSYINDSLVVVAMNTDDIVIRKVIEFHPDKMKIEDII